ncbi:hypothetical protein E3E12_08265 [Formicincola oecophyllae]|uniref:DUF4232 domain-containing protein n=1 Tax=Formicincola oecophyllae TaxID=2558361 RepID=A0A4Y6UCH4_9PROT|nr:hypothetical protein [Formicincola oecophyllae]QDH14186.1 hypothetical protein E3E12_08265 [Formicincola oecophyllae]
MMKTRNTTKAMPCAAPTPLAPLGCLASAGLGAGLFGLSVGLFSAGVASAAPVPPCQPGQVALTQPDPPGSYAGMSHNGTRLSFTNLSDHACSLPAEPELTFTGPNGRPYEIVTTSSYGTPTADEGGTVVLGPKHTSPPDQATPASPQAGAQATKATQTNQSQVKNHTLSKPQGPPDELGTILFWVSGNVFDRGRCFDIKEVSIKAGPLSWRQPLPAQMCGPATSPVRVDEPALKPTNPAEPLP